MLDDGAVEARRDEQLRAGVEGDVGLASRRHRAGDQEDARRVAGDLAKGLAGRLGPECHFDNRQATGFQRLGQRDGTPRVLDFRHGYDAGGAEFIRKARPGASVAREVGHSRYSRLALLLEVTSETEAHRG